MAPIWNIGIGLVMLIGGLTGKLSLIGTHSSGALALVGAGVTGLGVYQLMKRRRGQ